jgi:eukaryotic-like serine/threonine-protein kinase
VNANRPESPSRTGVSTEAAPDAEFESWLKKAARAPTQAILPFLPEIGAVIGEKYRIEEELGRGGMGAVFRATHLVSDKPVALKWMLRPTSDQRALERFTREARAAGRIDHPNVVDVYDIGHEGEASYLVMELLRGESFRHRLAKGALAPSDVVDLLLPALEGVAAAHREGVIHRDLKPDNIFLCQGRSGEARPAKVLDFGISTITSPDHVTQTALTTEGVLLGTPSYMAPEQIEAGAIADVRTDVYAFGVILYEALTGRVPFVADNYLALALAIAKGDPAPPRTLRPEISLDLERLVLQAMHKDPAKRPQSIEALAALLTPHARDPASQAWTPNVPISVERPLRKLPRRRGKIAGTAVSIAMVAFALVAWFWFRDAAPHAGPPAVAKPPVAPVQVQAGPATPPATPSTSTIEPELESPKAPVAAEAKPVKARRKEKPLAAPSRVEPAAEPLVRPGRAGRIRTDEL